MDKFSWLKLLFSTVYLKCLRKGTDRPFKRDARTLLLKEKWSTSENVFLFAEHGA